ncbi:MAG: ATP-dependent DNA ligase [Candidatus Micrarchaeota archaeon]
MRFKELALIFNEIEQKSGRLEMTDLVAQIYQKTLPEEAKKITYFIQGILAPPYFGINLGMGEKFAVHAIANSTGYLEKEIEQQYRELGDLGLVAQFFLEKKKQQALITREIEASEIYDVMLKIANTSGIGSQDLKIRILSDLLNSASPLEGKFIIRFVAGQLRLGIGDPTILDALSVTKIGDKSLRDEIERAYNLCDNLGLVAELFLQSSEEIKNFSVKPFVPIRPALAERLGTPQDIIGKIGECGIEFKFDGFRMQIHKKGEMVEIYSRNLEKITFMYPEVIQAVRKLKQKEIIFEGEALAFNEKKNRFYSFQETMHRRRKYGIEQTAKEYPLYVYIFDIIYVDGIEYLKLPYEARRRKIEEIFPYGILNLSKCRIAKNSQEIEEIFNEALEKGLEGIMAKDLKAPYVAGARKFAWIKLKKSYGKAIDTIDATIVGYYLGQGARAEFEFGGLLVAVYNPERGKFETIAKIGSGYSEEEMKNLKKMLSKIKTKSAPRDLDYKIKPDFWVTPKYVVEIAFDDITLSPMHCCGLKDKTGYALRFPRMMKLRKDKKPKESTTTQEIIDIYQIMRGKIGK